jgi:hypothetical protein
MGKAMNQANGSIGVEPWIKISDQACTRTMIGDQATRSRGADVIECA